MNEYLAFMSDHMKWNLYLMKAILDSKSYCSLNIHQRITLLGVRSMIIECNYRILLVIYRRKEQLNICLDDIGPQPLAKLGLIIEKGWPYFSRTCRLQS